MEPCILCMMLLLPVATSCLPQADAAPSLQCSQTALFFCPLNLIPEMRGALPQIKRRPSRPFPI